MKQLTLTVTLFLFALITHSHTEGFDIKATQKSLAKIGDNLYASKFEVTNNEYVTFLNFLKQSNQTDRFLTAQIDSSKWKDKSSYNEPFVKYYHAHPAYANYPVVNVSYEGAVLFCEWLTDQYNSNEKRKFKKVQFRLPTKAEWELAAKGGDPTATYPWKGNNLKTEKGVYRCNFKRGEGDYMGVAGKLNDNADVTAPVNSYMPNEFGLYNMSGNVAEMIADKGPVKGGSWCDSAEYLKIESEYDKTGHDAPMSNIGFRYFMEIIEE